MEGAGRYRLLQHNDGKMRKSEKVQLDFAFVRLARINTGFTSSLFDKATSRMSFGRCFHIDLMLL